MVRMRAMAVAMVSIVAVATACTDGEADSSGEDSSNVATRTGGGSAGAGSAHGTPALEELPSCEEIASLLGDALDGMMEPVDESNNNGTWDQGGGQYGVDCAWVAEELYGDDPREAFQAGSFSLGVSVSPYTTTRDDADALGWRIEDPRVEDVGAILVVPGAAWDPADQLGLVGPQVIRGKATVTLTATGVMLNRSKSTANLTNDWAVGAAVAVLGALG